MQTCTPGLKRSPHLSLPGIWDQQCASACLANFLQVLVELWSSYVAQGHLFAEILQESSASVASGQKGSDEERQGSCCVAQAGLELLASSDLPTLAYQKMGSHYIVQAGLKFLDSSNPLASASQSGRITDFWFVTLAGKHTDGRGKAVEKDIYEDLSRAAFRR
ncbi:hypothetical protein AAY473_007422 [Plecturocebus cupreus]